MLCEKCGQRQAEVFFQKVINGHKEEVHLCSQCAAGETVGFNFQMDPTSTFQNFLTSLMDQQSFFSPTYKYDQQVQCPHCQLSYENFRQAGRLGCSECYQAFKPLLGSFLQRIHGSDKHTGKIFGETDQLSKVKLEIKALQKQLQKAVELEKFEEAAEIRDKIKELEKQTSKGGEQV